MAKAVAKKKKTIFKRTQTTISLHMRNLKKDLPHFRLG